MAFKIQMADVSKQEAQQIRDERGSFTPYDGPVPPPDIYRVQVDGMWVGESRTGKPMFKVAFKIAEPDGSDKAVYNGASTIENYLIPQNPSDNGYVPQVDRLDALFAALSGGQSGIAEASEAMNAGRIGTGEEEKLGTRITQVGKVKVGNAKPFKAKTKFNTYNGEERLAIHYILNDFDGNNTSNDDLDVESGGDDENLDDILGV